MYWGSLLPVFAVCLVACSIGFKHFVWFMSIGYGFAIAAGGLAVLVIAAVHRNVSVILLCQAVIFLVYGLRLSLFLLLREKNNAAYKKTLNEATGNDKKMPAFVLAIMWIYCAFLYTAQVSPALYRVLNNSESVFFPALGLLISAAGIALEAAADKQKSAQKAARPDMVATKGLYKLCRCPNYFGEILVWTGFFVGSFTTLHGIGQWAMEIFAYVCIVIVMFNGAQRLEKRQNKRYGTKEEYRNYVTKTPIIIPFLPLYSLVKDK